MQSRSLLLTAPGQLEWVAEDLPSLQPDEVLVQTRAGAISIGAELPRYTGTARSARSPRYPHMTGYESIGTVAACGSQVKRLHVGQRVVAFYGHRTCAIVPESKAIVVPDDISDALALLTILSCDVSKGISKVVLDRAEPVLVTGAGTIGLLTVFMLTAIGSQNIDVIEPRVERRALAKLFGARETLNPREMEARNDMYAVGIECSSRNRAFELLQGKVRRDGRICILADGNVEPLVLTPAFHEKELSVVGSSDGRDYQGHAQWFFEIVRQRPHALERLFEYQTTANNLIQTFESLAQGAIQPIKVLVRYK
ncbi:MAG: alcohol dehydrogenase catalytic domain-containing protein [Ktedonobacteraceae bacterium]